MCNYFFIEDDFSEELNSLLEDTRYTKVVILVDENTKEHCLDIVSNRNIDYIIEIPSGEKNKSLSTCEYIWQKMTDYQLDRKALLINLGGGVIGDMGGFCAATYKRGIGFVNIPTTLLAMVDASVGGKLGVNFGSYKNHIGLFRDPKVVLVFPEFLKSLPERELKSGFAEVIKHALITGKKDWKTIRNFDFKKADWGKLINRSIKIKKKIVSKDWKEYGLRKTLNFGHTIGHAVESHYMTKKHPLLHGEAVAVGMIAELSISSIKLGFDSDKLDQIVKFILSIYGKIQIDILDYDDICKYTLHDKKNNHFGINAVLLSKIGSAKTDMPITSDDVIGALSYYNNLDLNIN